VSPQSWIVSLGCVFPWALGPYGATVIPRVGKENSKLDNNSSGICMHWKIEP